MADQNSTSVSQSMSPAARIARELSLLQVRLSPSDRRGLLFGRIVSEGLVALRPSLVDDVSGLALDQAAECILRVLSGGAADGTSKRRSAALEQRSTAVERFTAKDIARMRTLHTYGMSYADVASTMGCTADEARGLITGNWRKRAPSKPKALPAPDK